MIGAYFIFDPIETAIHARIAEALGLHMIAHNEMGLFPYGMLMVVRLALDLLVVAMCSSFCIALGLVFR